MPLNVRKERNLHDVFFVLKVKKNDIKKYILMYCKMSNIFIDNYQCLYLKNKYSQNGTVIFNTNCVNAKTIQNVLVCIGETPGSTHKNNKVYLFSLIRFII